MSSGINQGESKTHAQMADRDVFVSKIDFLVSLSVFLVFNAEAV